MKQIERLRVDALSRLGPGLHADGAGLYFQRIGEGRSWLFQFSSPTLKRVRQMGLGPWCTIDLREARRLALECRKLVLAGIDPIEQRRAQRAAAALEAGRSMTVREVVPLYLDAHAAEWSSSHQHTVRQCFANHILPVIGKAAIAAIDQPAVLRCLSPIWESKTTTAAIVRGRLEGLLDFAKVKGLRKGEANPAKWEGNLEYVLPSPSSLAQVTHMAALDYKAIPEFMALLRQRQEVECRAIEALVLTVARTNDLLHMQWSELNFQEKTWSIPQERFKSRRPFVVPLSERVLEILRERKRVKTGPYVFENPYSLRHRRLAQGGLLYFLRSKLNESTATIHGFRSAFKTYSAEVLNFERVVVEVAMGHAVGDKLEEAYMRGTYLAKRAVLMERWSEFCSGIETGNVTLLRST